jgi:hypothetical protein
MSVIEAAPTLRSNRAGNFRTWHETDQAGRSVDVRSSGQTGSGWQRGKPTRMTHMRHFELEQMATDDADAPASPAALILISRHLY